MLKTLKTLFKQDKEKFVIPKSVQAIIPIKTIWEDGIFLVGNNKYAKTFKFEDINLSLIHILSLSKRRKMLKTPHWQRPKNPLSPSLSQSSQRSPQRGLL